LIEGVKYIVCCRVGKGSLQTEGFQTFKDAVKEAKKSMERFAETVRIWELKEELKSRKEVNKT